MTRALPVPRMVPADLEVLERRARALAAGRQPEEGRGGSAEPGALRLVSFQLGGKPCAVDASIVERAVVLARPIAVPLAEGSERLVAFVLEKPLPVADLAAAASGAQRSAADLDGAPAIVVSTPAGPVAVVVEGPLDLAEDVVAGTAEGHVEGEPVRISGRLAGGGVLVDAGWLASWAGRVG